MSRLPRARCSSPWPRSSAAGVVAGVVLATRQDPAQPRRGARTALGADDPGADDASAPPSARRSRKGPSGQRARSRGRQRAAERSGRPVQLRGRALLRGLPRRGGAGVPQGEEGGARHRTRSGRRAPAPAVLQPRRAIRSSSRADPIRSHRRGGLQQRKDHQQTAERLYRAAAQLHPNDADAQVAAAVGRFDKDDLSASFSRLGPLVKRFPRSQTVRFHLGLLLAWTGQGDPAITEFRLARELGPRTGAREAGQYLPLTASCRSGTKGQVKISRTAYPVRPLLMRELPHPSGGELVGDVQESFECRGRAGRRRTGSWPSPRWGGTRTTTAEVDEDR